MHAYRVYACGLEEDALVSILLGRLVDAVYDISDISVCMQDNIVYTHPYPYHAHTSMPKQQSPSNYIQKNKHTLITSCLPVYIVPDG